MQRDSAWDFFSPFDEVVNGFNHSCDSDLMAMREERIPELEEVAAVQHEVDEKAFVAATASREESRLCYLCR